MEGGGREDGIEGSSRGLLEAAVKGPRWPEVVGREGGLVNTLYIRIKVVHSPGSQDDAAGEGGTTPGYSKRH